MKQLLILSGKGGTGKTTIAASFIHLMDGKAFADCDVDAPNLHLVTSMTTEPSTQDYFGLDKAVIDQSMCVDCGKCQDNCRFGAIENSEGRLIVNPFACEGCGVCSAICPVSAIQMVKAIAGELKSYEGNAVFSTATLKMGSGTSGKLVTEVKKALKKGVMKGLENGTISKEPIGIIDGSPGIGCPVIASISGVNLILIVTEPTVSGISDMKRVIEIGNHFKIKMAICTNKHDVNSQKTEEIKAFAAANQIPFVGVIPYDTAVAKAINAGIIVIEGKGVVSEAIRKVFDQTMALLD